MMEGVGGTKDLNRIRFLYVTQLNNFKSIWFITAIYINHNKVLMVLHRSKELKIKEDSKKWKNFHQQKKRKDKKKKKKQV